MPNKSVKNRPKRLVLVRHGESEANFYLNQVIKGEIFTFPPELAKMRDWDIRLTERGKEQARKTGEYLKNNFELFDACFVSPQQRTRETFEEILSAFKENGENEILRSRMRSDSRLREKDHGATSYLSEEELKRFLPHEYERRNKEGKLLFRPLGGESWYDVKDLRVGTFLNMIYRDHADENILIVSHSITINCFRMKLERLQEEEVLEIVQKEPLDNCGIAIFESDPKQGGRLILRAWNKIAY